MKILLGTRKGLLTWRATPTGWRCVQESHLGIPVSYAVRDARTGVTFACLDHGHWGCKFQRSADDGASWRELAAPAYPEGAELKDGRPAVLQYLWCLTPGTEEQAGRIYVGTAPGGLFVSDDLGDSFQLVESLWNHPSRKEIWMGGGLDEAGIHSVLIDPRDPQRLLVGVSVAGVFASDDGGATWEPRNRGLRADFLPDPAAEIGHDPHLLVQCRSQPDVLWQQNHCGVFRSTDCGRTWRDVSQPDGPVGFGFAIAVDPEDGDTAWVVPARGDEMRIAIDHRLMVCRTTDGGATWETFDQGLPSENCYDFAFRHALDQQGDWLAMGTVGGSLYVSSDRGATWQTLTNHLPPVYSLRFS